MDTLKQILSQDPNRNLGQEKTSVIRQAETGTPLHVEETTPFLEACLIGHLEAIEIFLEQPSQINPHEKLELDNSAFSGYSPYRLAKKLGHHHVCAVIEEKHPAPKSETGWKNIFRHLGHEN